MKFLVDVQLPPTLARWLVGRGDDAIHAIDIGMDRVTDLELWDYASQHQRIMVSKDGDFFILAMRPKDEGSLLWLRLGNCRTIDLLSNLNKNWDQIEAAFSSGQQVVEVR